MKTLIHSIIVLVVTLTVTLAFASKEYTMNDVYGKGGVAYDKKLKKPISGVVKKFYNSGELKDQMAFENGKPNGTQKRYYKSGKLMGEISYKNGKAISGYMFEDGGRKVKMTGSNLAALNSHP